MAEREALVVSTWVCLPVSPSYCHRKFFQE